MRIRVPAHVRIPRQVPVDFPTWRFTPASSLSAQEVSGSVTPGAGVFLQTCRLARVRFAVTVTANLRDKRRTGCQNAAMKRAAAARVPDFPERMQYKNSRLAHSKGNTGLRSETPGPCGGLGPSHQPAAAGIQESGREVAPDAFAVRPMPQSFCSTTRSEHGAEGAALQSALRALIISVRSKNHAALGGTPALQQAKTEMDLSQ